MKSLIIALGFFISTGLMAMPTPGVQDKGTANLSFGSEGTIGATVGVFEEKNIKGEVSFDYNVPHAGSFDLGTKIGVDECKMSTQAPSFDVGVFNARIKGRGEALTHNNVFYAITAKSFYNGKAHIGVFHGNKTMGTERKGYFVGYTHHLIIENIDETHKRSKMDLSVEYVSGKSFLGGAKAELKYLITPKLSIRGGPVWEFNKIMANNPKKWSTERVKYVVTMSLDI